MGAAGDSIKARNMDEFITRYRVEKGCEFTHTSLGTPRGSFYVPSDALDDFYDLYTTALEEGRDMYVTEKPRHIGPLTIDLDFRFNVTDGPIKRQYSLADIVEVTKIYTRAVSMYLQALSPTTGSNVSAIAIDAYIMEKPGPTLAGTLVKDGVHILFPNVITRASIKHLIRDYVLTEIGPVLERIGVSNSIVDVVDEAVIQKNNWLMYGSKKVGGEPYKVTHILRFTSTDTFTVLNEPRNTDDYTRILSIRNKYDELSINMQQAVAIREYESIQDNNRKHHEYNKIANGPTDMRTNESDQYELARVLVDILNPDRTNSYPEWIRTGWCLRNIDYRLLDKWVEFSKKSPKYVAGECEKYWNRMRESGLGFGTLNMWARSDNVEEYKKLIRNDLKNLIYQSSTATHVDVAKVVHHMFKNEFVCSSLKNSQWYEFRDHRWHPSDSGIGLRLRISDDVWKEYHTAAVDYHTRCSTSTDPHDQSRYQDLAKKMTEIAMKLRTTAFKVNVVRECTELFHKAKFEETLDSNINLIGFNNGVYDLECDEFREGHPEDYISFTTKQDYIPYDATHPHIQAINDYMAQVLTRGDVREYVLKLFASFLSGHTKEQKFYIWTGSGSNSKSCLVEFFESAFGDYCCKFPITLLTQKRAASNAATSELARAKGRRFASLQEPSNDEQINIGLMKELSGGDKIFARALYSEPIEFKPQFKMILLCNHLPKVPSDDGGTWRRIRVVEFKSKFVDNPSAENEFPIDKDLPERMQQWRAHFMSMLLQYYRRYLNEGMQEPMEVLKCTMDYKAQNDYLAHFISNFVEKKDSAFLTLDDFYMEMRNWIRDDGVSQKVPSKPELERYLSRNFAKCVVHNHLKGFKGFRIRAVMQDTMDEDHVPVPVTAAASACLIEEEMTDD